MMRMTVGRVGRWFLWRLIRGSCGCFTIEGDRVVYILVPIPSAGEGKARELAEWIAGKLSGRDAC